MSYSIGSLADLISGKETPNKPKTIERKVKHGTSKKSNLSSESKEYSKDSRSTLKNDLQIGSSKFADGEVAKSFSKKTKLSNPEKRLKAKQSKQNAMSKLKHDLCKDRTLFVGNVAISTTKTALRKRFGVYGRIESIRFRSVPVPDPKTPKKLAAIKQQYHANRTSLHSYIKFESAEDSVKALVENGRVYDAHHIRVSHCNEDTATRDESRAIFVGNLSFDCEEEELWPIFSECGSIESVRVVRDRRTSIGRGFGYVNFTSADSVQMALQLDNTVTVRNRQLRISVCNVKSSNKKKAKKRKESSTSATTPPIKKTKEPSQDNFQGLKFTDAKKKKKIDKGAAQKKKIANLLALKT